MCSLSSVSVAQAQTALGKIQGRVSDSQQLALDQPAVELQDAKGNMIRKTVGEHDGHYELDDVPAGDYSLKFTHDGFEAVTKGPISVGGGQTSIVDAILEPEHVVQTVTVVGSLEDERNTGSKTNIPLQDLPVTVQTVPQEIIKQQNSTDIVSVINNLPAANAWTQYGSLNYFEFRGFVLGPDPGSSVLLNGLRIEGNREDSQINSVESVDVLKGPASMLYGAQDIGGTINIIEKQPIATPQYDLVLRGGGYGTGGFELGATGPVKNDNLLYRVDTAYTHSNGFRGAGSDRFNISPKLFWRIRPADSFRLYLNYNLDHFDGDAGIPLIPGPNDTFIYPNVNINNRYNSPGNFENTSYPVIQAFYEHAFSDNLHLREALQYQYIGDEYWESEGLEVDPSNPTQVLRGADYFSVYFFHHDNAVLNQTDLDGSFHLIWKHQFLIGYEYDTLFHKTKRSDDAENSIIPPINLYNPVQTSSGLTSFPASSYDGLRNTSNAIYFQDYVRIHPKLQFLFSGRYDGYRHYDFNDPVVNGAEVITPHTDMFSQNPFTYRVGLNAPLLPFFSAYASYSTAFTAQTSLSTSGNTLKPETAQQSEIGGRFNFFQSRLTMDVDWFHIIRQNVDVERPDGVIDQAGQQYAKGAEVEIRGRVSQRLSVYATYGFTQTAYDNFTTDGFFADSPAVVSLRGNTPGLTPRHTASIWTTYDFTKGFSVSAGAHYMSKRSTDSYDFFYMPGFTTVDAAIRYRRARMEYSINITNLLDNTHYLVSAIDDTQVYPGMPINVNGTVRFHF
jgi:iron complex outermembrane recepter protein